MSELKRGVLAGERRALARAITLIESRRASDRERAEGLLQELLPHTGRALRLGLSGAPGAGKSTLIERLGLYAIERGQRVAVLSIDPSSALSGGSILGDKTRMVKLSAHPQSFIRPSPSSGTLGGIAPRTREARLLCEAAGYDLVIIETVGVGQSEHAVAGMVDTFLMLALAGTGDELQGIKRGILEFADIIAVNKADGDNRQACENAARELAGALRLLHGAASAWQVPVLTTSALSGAGIPELWGEVRKHNEFLSSSGGLERRRKAQQRDWFSALVEQAIRERMFADTEFKRRYQRLERAVLDGAATPSAAVTALFENADE